MSDDMNNSSSSNDDPPSRSLVIYRLSRDLYVALGICELTGIGLSVAAFFSSRPGDFWPIQLLAFLLFHLPHALSA